MGALKRLAVYCGSASPADPRYIESAREVGRTSPSAESAWSTAAGAPG